MAKAVLFLSTPSARRATQARWNMCTEPLFLSTPSARRATRLAGLIRRRTRISIHALREEGDHHHPGSQKAHLDFYPRPPRGGRRGGVRLWACITEFLSTPSARRATMSPRPTQTAGTDFYPRPPRGGRLPVYQRRAFGFGISIHALREEGDLGSPGWWCSPPHFYPRPPRGGRRFDFWSAPHGRYISIHALREEGDEITMIDLTGYNISIHALREEGDAAAMRCTGETSDFYPRPPRGGRRSKSPKDNLVRLFLSTPSARRATVADSPQFRIVGNFYPRPPRGGRHPFQIFSSHSLLFLSTPSARRATPASSPGI